MANFRTMSVQDLLRLRSEVDAMLQSKRSELQRILQQLGGGNGSPTRGSTGGKVAAKYRHPVTGETWSGRGATVRWLAEEIKAGRKKEDFLIDESTKSQSVKKNGSQGKKSKKITKMIA